MLAQQLCCLLYHKLGVIKATLKFLGGIVTFCEFSSEFTVERWSRRKATFFNIVVPASMEGAAAKLSMFSLSPFTAVAIY